MVDNAPNFNIRSSFEIVLDNSLENILNKKLGNLSLEEYNFEVFLVSGINLLFQPQSNPQLKKSIKICVELFFCDSRQNKFVESFDFLPETSRIVFTQLSNLPPSSIVSKISVSIQLKKPPATAFGASNFTKGPESNTNHSFTASFPHDFPSDHLIKFAPFLLIDKHYFIVIINSNFTLLFKTSRSLRVNMSVDAKVILYSQKTPIIGPIQKTLQFAPENRQVFFSSLSKFPNIQSATFIKIELQNLKEFPPDPVFKPPAHSPRPSDHSSETIEDPHPHTPLKHYFKVPLPPSDQIDKRTRFGSLLTVNDLSFEVFIDPLFKLLFKPYSPLSEDISLKVAVTLFDVTEVPFKSFGSNLLFRTQKQQAFFRELKNYSDTSLAKMISVVISLPSPPN